MNRQRPFLSRQRGAIGISMVLMLLSLLLLAALAIDTGRLYFAKRQLQTQADLAALSMSRSICYIDGINNRAALEQKARNNLAANGFDGTATFAYGSAYIDNNHWLLDTTSTMDQSAARVSLTRTLPASLLAGGLIGDDIQLTANSTVQKRLGISYSLGSGVLDADLTNSLLSGLIGGNLSLLSYDGLVDTGVNLGQLLGVLGDNTGVDLSLANIDSILSTNISALDLADAMINVLGSNDENAVAVSLLNQVVASGSLGDLDLALGDIISLSTQAGEPADALARAVLETDINAFDLLLATLLAANQSNAISLTGLGVDLGLVGVEVVMDVIEPPQYKIGYYPARAGDEFATTVKTAQVNTTVKATLLPGGLNLGIVSLNASSIGVHVEAGAATAQLLDVDGCTLASGIDMDFSVQPSLATVSIGDGDDPTQPVSISATALSALGVSVPIEVNISADVDVTPADPVEGTLTLMNQPLPYTERITAPLGDSISGALSTLDLELSVDLLGSGLLSSVISSVVSTLTSGLLPLVGTLIGSLVSGIVDPLLGVLGISTSYADLTILSVDVDQGGLIQ
ncbi:pilus assembly protein TadG-related protein [Pokkaliibacter sp. CJK22405]|uniref:pilus assembly protein TadG-related protein n=1 Tax=Pokkaliibacter sp. CJK22405 TaxID=3384615 RepID=UPI0039846237